MVTTKINIKQHLAEYVNNKYFNKENSCVIFSDKLDIYHVIWDLLEKRPDNCFRDEGNVVLGLPSRREGKDPEYFNYLGLRSVKTIEKRLETMFIAEMRALCDENKHRLGITYLESTNMFACKYGIQSLTPDALYKDYYRWRTNTLKRTKTKRKYQSNN